MIASLSENVVGTCRRNKAKPPIKANVFYIKNGGRTWARTKDPLIKSQLLYQLSYASIPGRFWVAPWCGAPLLEARC